MESDDLSSLWGFNNPCSTDDRGFGSVMPMTDYIPKDGGQVISDEEVLTLLDPLYLCSSGADYPRDSYQRTVSESSSSSSESEEKDVTHLEHLLSQWQKEFDRIEASDCLPQENITMNQMGHHKFIDGAQLGAGFEQQKYHPNEDEQVNLDEIFNKMQIMPIQTCDLLSMEKILEDEMISGLPVFGNDSESTTKEGQEIRPEVKNKETEKNQEEMSKKPQINSEDENSPEVEYKLFIQPVLIFTTRLVVKRKSTEEETVQESGSEIAEEVHKACLGTSYKHEIPSAYQSCFENGGKSGKLGVQRVHRPRTKPNRCYHLWDFLQDILTNKNDKASDLMEWVNKETKEFRILDTKGLAALWGEKKRSTNMNYGKLSRVIRYYCKLKILERSKGKRLHFRFGERRMWKKVDA